MIRLRAHRYQLARQRLEHVSAPRQVTLCAVPEATAYASCCADFGEKTPSAAPEVAPVLSPTRSPSMRPIPIPTASPPVPAPTLSTPLGLSSCTCDNLGWDPLPRGSADVCGENSLGLGGCSGELAYDDAKIFCESKGARICRIEDYKNNEAYGSSCGIEWSQKWSSSACENAENGAIESYSWAMGPAAMVRVALSHIALWYIQLRCLLYWES